MIKENTPRLETERLILRKFTSLDLAAVFAIYNDTTVNRFLPWFPVETSEAAKAFLRDEILPEYAKEVAYRYAVAMKNSGAVVGYITMTGIDTQKATADLGYGLRQDYWGQGIIVEGCRAVLKRLQKNGFSDITATHDVNNPASGRVMEKLGMAYQYAYDEQWQPKDIMVRFKLYQLDLQKEDKI